MNNIFEEIKKERKRQNEKFGIQNNSAIEWIAIIAEEFGEASKEAIDHHFKYGFGNYKNNPNYESSKDAKRAFDDLQFERLKNYRKELIEVAAVVVHAIQNLDGSINSNYYAINKYIGSDGIM